MDVRPSRFVTVNPARFETLDAGCPGTVGIPELRLTQNWPRAWLGRALSVDATNLSQSTGFLAVGWSSTLAGTIYLPLDLTPFGMPGCALRVATDVIYPLVGANHVATHVMPVPNVAALIGCQLYQQPFAIDPAAKAAGLVPGGSVRVTIGSLQPIAAVAATASGCTPLPSPAATWPTSAGCLGPRTYENPRAARGFSTLAAQSDRGRGRNRPRLPGAWAPGSAVPEVAEARLP